MSNYSQNNINYFESLVGELYNLKQNNLITWFVLVIFDEIPYFNKNNEIVKYENKLNFNKYMDLLKDLLLNCLSIIVISGGEFLKHPNKIDTKLIDYENFYIKSYEPMEFSIELKNFCSMIKNEF
jgi:hypothetical protein